jgi:hypothetical protein
MHAPSGTIAASLLRAPFMKITAPHTIILFVTSNHQATNLVFPNFFHEFFSAWAVEKENKLLIDPEFYT